MISGKLTLLRNIFDLIFQYAQKQEDEYRLKCAVILIVMFPNKDARRNHTK